MLLVCLWSGKLQSAVASSLLGSGDLKVSGDLEAKKDSVVHDTLVLDQSGHLCLMIVEC